MGFVNNGGLFIPTVKEFGIGHELFLVLSLPEEVEKIPVSCRVVWITPLEAQGNSTPGIGVQFKDDGIARTKIETILAGLLKSDKPNYTM
jgi:type IV pilus assembly protein PilZ